MIFHTQTIQGFSTCQEMSLCSFGCFPLHGGNTGAILDVDVFSQPANAQLERVAIELASASSTVRVLSRCERRVKPCRGGGSIVNMWEDPSENAERTREKQQAVTAQWSVWNRAW